MYGVEDMENDKKIVEENVRKHPDYAEEKEFLEDTIKDLEEKAEQSQNDYKHNKEQCINYRKIQDRASSNEANVYSFVANNNKNKEDKLRYNLDEPYFARVDFKDNSNSNVEKLYIGNVDFNNDKSDKIIIHYNNPAAELFYEHKVGRAWYSAPDGEHKGDIYLRRTFKIKEHELISIFDDKLRTQLLKKVPKCEGNDIKKQSTKVKEKIINDPLLDEQLNKSTDNKLKHIIETIQREQYQIIRQPLNQVTLVQGTAGSGKSTVAMHRISYLIYNKKVIGEEVAIIAPNKIFLDYISDILPDLNIKEITQFTIESLAEKVINESIKIYNCKKLEYIANCEEGYLNQILSKLIVDSSSLKSSLEFKKIVDKYLENKSNDFISSLKDIELFQGRFKMSLDNIKKYWYADDSPYNLKIGNIKRYIESMIDNYINKDSRDNTIPEYVLRRDETEFLSKYFSSYKRLNYKDAYIEVLNDINDLACGLGLERYLLEFIRKQSLDQINSGKFEREDIAPLCYLKIMISGMPKSLKFDHIVIDEAQDLSLFEFDFLKKLTMNNSFTIMGDIAQGINSFRGIRSWEKLKTEVFNNINLKDFILNQSYRSTKEIVEFYNMALPNTLPKGKPVYRSGEKPEKEKVENYKILFGRMISLINHYKKSGCNSIAVITGSEKESIKIYNKLFEKFDSLPVQLLTSETKSYKTGITITSVENAKGLEFDAVLVIESEKTNYKKDELHKKLLYVAMSRALHYLHVFVLLQ